MAEREDETLYEVTGIVGGPAGKPLAGVRVVVWWRQIRELRELAVGETFEDGRYHLRYALPENAPGPVLIVVEALSELFEPRLFSRPAPAAPRLEIDLAFEPRDESEWATLVRAIEPLLDGLELDELVESDSHQDLTFLSRELGKSTEELMQVALSARLARQFDLPAPVFYAFLDQRVPASLPFPLLDASQGFTLVDSLVQDIASLVFALAPEEQESTLTAAVALDLIGPEFTRRIPALVEELQSLRSTDLLSRPYASGTASLSQLLDVAGLPPETQQTFANLLAANDGPLDDFWSTLEAGRSGLSTDEAEAVERVLSIGSLAGNYVPLVQAVDAEFAAGRYSSLSQVATLTLDEWTALVAKSGVPEGTEAGASDTPEAAFAKAVYTRAIRAFPTVALSSRIASAGLVPKQEQAPLERFFANNPDLELVTDNLALYLDGAGKEAFGGIPAGEQAKVVAAARGFQRVLRVSPDADVAQALIVAGITSASQIANAGRAQFAAVATEAGLSAAETSLAYEVSAHRYATVVAKYMQLNADAVGVLPKMIGDLGDLGKTIQGAVKRDQSLAALFGSQDYCAVEDCTSVLGPAAYLCDLLLWLKNHPQGSHTALDTFDARRPDVRNLLLNCQNSDTELPYVDLVNELLADTIAPPSGSGSTLNPRWKQTSESATADQLRAAPEYFNQDAYVKLHGASYPQSLPYSTGLDELRTYLQSWNLPLWQLREALLPLAGGSVAQQAAVAAERLGMNRHAEHLVVTPNAVSPAVAWNTSDFSATAPNGLATVPVFLQASSLDYESLLELLEVSWVQNGLGIHLVGLNDTCDTTGMALAPAPLDTGFLDRSNRFLRLWLATGYKMWELDLLLNAPSVGNGKLDRKTLVALQAFWELQAQTKLEVDEQLALYQDLDVEAHLDPDGTTTTSRYAQVFLNPTTTWAAPDPDLESLPLGGPIGDPALADHVKSIQPALAVSAAEIATLFTLTDGMLTLANLSLVYRVSLLATASRLAIADLLTVATLLAPGAASQTAALEPLLASPAATLDFLGQATAIQQSSLSLDTLTYLLTPPVSGAWTTTSQMAPTEMATTLGGVQQAIVTLLAAGTTLTASIAAGDTAIDVASGAGFPAAPFYVYVGSEILQVNAIGGTAGTHWTVARGRLGTTAAGAAAGAAVTPTSGDMDGAVVAAVAAGAHTATAAPLANDVTALILGTLEVPGTGKRLLATLEDPALVAPTGTVAIGGAPAAGDTLTAVITDVSGAAVTVAYTLVAADAGDPEQTAASFAAAIEASAAVAGPAAFLAGCTASGAVISLTALTPAAPGTSVTCSVSAAPGGAGHVTVSPDEASLDGVPAVSTASFPDQFAAIQLVDKVGILVRGLRLVASDLSWLLENAAAYGGTDLIALPVTAAQPALPLTPLLTTLLLLKQERSYISAPATAAVQTLYDLIGGVGTGAIAAEADAQAALAAITGWPVADIEAFSRALELSFPASYTQPEAFSALRDLEVMSQSVDTSGPVVSAGTTLVTAIDNVQTSITVASAIGFPTPEFYVSIGAEILLVSAVGGADDTNWTVARGRQGTTAGAAGIGAIVTPTYGAQLVSWGAVPHDEVAAEALAASALGVLKAQQPTEEAWLTLAPTLMDPIRDRRSAALRAYLTAKRSSSGELVYPDDDALFDYFLIDVEMSSCQVTSRVVQAYIAVQIFVERCLMNLETTKWDSTARGVIVDLSADDTWNQWEWMKRYRIWEANREVFLFPENWLIESQRPNRTEIYEQFEQNVRQGQSTADYLETTVLDYIESLDDLSHLLVTGTARDPATGTIYVIARTIADPPTFYSRSYADGAWSGWAQIPLDIKAHQAIPAVYRGRECVFWLDVKVQNEPKQTTAPAVPNEKTQSQNVNRYVSLAVNFSIYSNGSWGPPQVAKGSLFDKPTFDSSSEAGDPKSIEALYTLKVQSQPAAPGLGTSLYLDVFRLGTFSVKNMYNEPGDPMNYQVSGVSRSVAIHLGRAVFDGRVSDLELANVEVPGVYPDNFQQDVDYAFGVALLTHAKQVYGPDAQPLIPLTSPDPNLTGESGLLPVAGALAAFPSATGGAKQTLHLSFPGSVELLGSATLPVRVVGPSTDLALDPRRYFFFQDNRRCYFVEAHRTQETERGKTGKGRTRAPFELTYRFRPFYHPFTRLAWNQLGAGGFDLLYDPELQLAPDAIDPSYPDVFSFKEEYDPTWRVTWDLADATTQLTEAITASQTHLEVANAIWVPVPPVFVKVGSEQMKVTAVSGADRTTWAVHRAQNGTTAKAAAEGAAVAPIDETRDRQFLDFGPSAPFSVYNWELFYHVPRYIADLLSQNQQFEDAQTWYRYIFDPTGQGPDPVPERFWIPKPLRGLTSAEILSEQIETLLTAVNEGDAGAVGQVTAWRNDPFNPFVLADLRPVAYMKSTVMAYLDNLIAWADNLFASESREALSEATLIYVIASEILGPEPTAVTPPPHADMSFDQLEPLLDAFANAMVEIENVIGPTGEIAELRERFTEIGFIPRPQTFYFKIPPNDQLLGYWGTVDDRLYKLRHCESIAGAPLELALFDAPIDPGLLIAARAAGVDLSSVLTSLNAAVPNYRFTALYPQALDFVNAVRAYGSSLQAALEKVDAGSLSLLQQTTQKQLLSDGDDVLQLQVQQAQKNLDGLNQALALSQQRYDFNSSQDFANDAEIVGTTLHTLSAVLKGVASAISGAGAGAAAVPTFYAGAAGFGGSPVAMVSMGGKQPASALHLASRVMTIASDALEIGAGLSNTIGSWEHRMDNWKEAATEAQIQMLQTQDQIDGATLALEVAQRNVELHQEQIANIQKQIDFLNDKFTSNSLYDWMVTSLAGTYFQSYQLAYQLCKQVERCYQFELGLQGSSFIQFGYWDSLHKGLLAGESLNHDLRRMQSSYLQQNGRRYELSRYVSLGALDPDALQGLLVNGSCDFTLPESLFDGDYPGHYNRRLTRVSLTVVYPSPGKFDNVKATLTLVSNQVRVKADTSSGYEESPIGSDPRFVYTYAANSQKIAMGNAQDDPGLFITAIASNIADQRYLPFENAGAISSWHLELPQASNEIDISTVGDVVIHLYYTALDGGGELASEVEASNLANLPTSGLKLFSAQNDFTAPAATAANPYPVTPWSAFLAAGATQKLTLAIPPSKFPPWTRGKTISVTGITAVAVAWEAGSFTLVPQAPLPTTPVTLSPVAGVTEPNVCAGTVVTPPGTPLGTWSFELQQEGAADFQSLTKNLLGDVLLLVAFQAS